MKMATSLLSFEDVICGMSSVTLQHSWWENHWWIWCLHLNSVDTSEILLCLRMRLLFFPSEHPLFPLCFLLFGLCVGCGLTTTYLSGLSSSYHQSVSTTLVVFDVVGSSVILDFPCTFRLVSFFIVSQEKLPPSLPPWLYSRHTFASSLHSLNVTATFVIQKKSTT